MEPNDNPKFQQEVRAALARHLAEIRELTVKVQALLRVLIVEESDGGDDPVR